jgi:hypothetical protein
LWTAHRGINIRDSGEYRTGDKWPQQVGPEK